MRVIRHIVIRNRHDLRAASCAGAHGGIYSPESGPYAA
jgi:hypothetical protein